MLFGCGLPRVFFFFFEAAATDRIRWGKIGEARYLLRAELTLPMGHLTARALDKRLQE